jgi:CheY-like chemotaxis protein
MPVVVVTGYTVEEGQDLLLSEKADGFLHKPFKVNEIESILGRLLGHIK